MVGAVFNSNASNTTAEAGFNNQAYHTPPIALNMLTNAILGQLAPGGSMNSTVIIACIDKLFSDSLFGAKVGYNYRGWGRGTN